MGKQALPKLPGRDSQFQREVRQKMNKIAVEGSKMMNSQKSRIHQVFGVSCLVFGMKFMTLYRHVRILNTKHQILNTLIKCMLF